jgi:hypothetical protein
MQQTPATRDQSRGSGLAIFGAIIAAFWFPVAYVLGTRYERESVPGNGEAVTPGESLESSI